MLFKNWAVYVLGSPRNARTKAKAFSLLECPRAEHATSYISGPKIAPMKPAPRNAFQHGS